MKFLQRASEAAKNLPKAAWVAAVIVPGGFIAVGTWLIYKSTKEKTK